MSGRGDELFRNFCLARSVPGVRLSLQALWLDHLVRPSGMRRTSFPNSRFTYRTTRTKILLSDSNANQLSDSHDTAFLRSFLMQESLGSVPYGVTFHRGNTDTWLDLCIVDALDTVIDYWNTETPIIDDHEGEKARCFTYRNLRKRNLSELCDFLTGCVCEWLEGTARNTEIDVDRFYAYLNAAVEQFVPLRSLKINIQKQRWFDGRIDSLEYNKTTLYRRFKRTRLDTDLHVYRTARDLLQKSIKNANLNFFKCRLVGLSDSSGI